MTLSLSGAACFTTPEPAYSSSASICLPGFYAPPTEKGNDYDYYRTNVAVPFIDHLLQELKTHYEQENRVGKIFTLVPAAITNESNLSDLASRLQFWEIDMPLPSSLLSELKLWKKFWEQYHKKSKKMCLPENIDNCLIETDGDVYRGCISKYFYTL